MNFDYESRLILKYVGGSYAYGTNIEDSDTDYRGVVIPPKSYFLGLDRFEQHESKNPDLVYFGIRKMVSLALSGNPNILESLYVDEYVLMTPYGTRLLEIRDEFLARNCVRAYMGYAQQQLHRLNGRSDPVGRVEKRQALIEKYGYDTKYALHVFRLLKTGTEVLKEGVLRVRRPDAAFLLDIRNGKYTLAQVNEMAEASLKEMREAEEKSTLPERPNYNRMNKVVVGIVEDYLKENG